MSHTRRVAILLFDEVEVLDFCGPFEVFSVASKQAEPRLLDVMTVSKQSSVVAVGGLSVNPQYTLADCPPPDVILVPGGVGSRQAMKDDATLDWVRSAAAGAELVLSVCTGALILGNAGLLDSLDVTTHHDAYDLLREIVPTATVHEDRRFVDNGKIVTSAGISAGIDMSLHVVQRLFGPSIAEATVHHMEYEWNRGS